MLRTAIAVVGPPAAGKTTLTLQLSQAPGRRVFRLREHVPHAVLAATATDAARLGWIDNFTVITSVHQYVETLIRDSTIHTLLLDNFPGTGTQASLFLSVLRQLAPQCTVMAVELTSDLMVLRHRALQRRVCPTCEHDPLCDPRLPAEASPADQARCARCNQMLDARRGDQPALYRARLQRYQQAAADIRQAFMAAGVSVVQIDSSHSLEHTAQELGAILTR